MWKFDEKEIQWVVPPANYGDRGQSVELLCCAIGDFERENIATVSGAFSRRVKYPHEIILCGVFNVKYREKDKVYIQKAFSGPDFDTVAVDDILYVETKKGNISIDCSDNCRTGIIRQTRLNISSLLDRGDNKVKINIIDLCGDRIGTEGLVLVRERGNDPREEISRWQEYEATEVDVKLALNDRRYLQSIDAPAYKLTDGFKEWNAILASLSFDEDPLSNRAILYEMSFLLSDETHITGMPPVGETAAIKCYDVNNTYNNLLYSKYTDRDSLSHTLDEDFGWITIKEDFAIGRVEIYGKGLKSPGFVDVNGMRRFWHHYICNPGKIGNEILRFDFRGFPNEYKYLEIVSSPHTKDGRNERGAKITGICVRRL